MSLHGNGKGPVRRMDFLTMEEVSWQENNAALCIQPGLLLPLPISSCLDRKPGSGSSRATLFAHKHAAQQVRAPLMNYSSPSISSAEVPDKSQALKWISRLTCLHRAGPPLPSPTATPSPPLAFAPAGDKCLTEAIRGAAALTGMWQWDTQPTRRQPIHHGRQDGH